MSGWVKHQQKAKDGFLQMRTILNRAGPTRYFHYTALSWLCQHLFSLFFEFIFGTILAYVPRGTSKTENSNSHFFNGLKRASLENEPWSIPPIIPQQSCDCQALFSKKSKYEKSDSQFSNRQNLS
jgi:hypothetical protein